MVWPVQGQLVVHLVSIQLIGQRQQVYALRYLPASEERDLAELDDSTDVGYPDLLVLPWSVLVAWLVPA
jgi:hypothetical protein